MKSSVQAKIDHMIKMAAGSTIPASQCIKTKTRNADSLSQAIRNQKEAAEFLEDLKTAFERANRQNERVVAL